MDSYDLIDRFLRNNLDDEDYAHFSCALDAVYAGQQDDALTAANERIRELEAALARRRLEGSVMAEDLCAAKEQLLDEREVSDKLEAALAGVRATLWVANEIPNGPINDTIWHTKHETLFDFMDAALSEVAAIRAKK